MRFALLFRINQLLILAAIGTLIGSSIDKVEAQSADDSLFPGRASAQHTSPIRWLENADQALQQAQQTGKPILAYITSDHCGYCRKMDRESWASPRVVGQVNEQFIPLKINAAQQPAQVQALQVQAFPTTLLLTQDGRVATGSAGFLPPDKLTNLLQQAGAMTRRNQPITPVSTH